MPHVSLADSSVSLYNHNGHMDSARLRESTQHVTSVDLQKLLYNHNVHMDILHLRGSTLCVFLTSIFESLCSRTVYTDGACLYLVLIESDPPRGLPSHVSAGRAGLLSGTRIDCRN